MAVTESNHQTVDRRRRIGPIGTAARIIVGLVLLGSVVQGHLARGWHLSSWALGLLGFPALLLAWQWLRARHAAPMEAPARRDA
jgi:hypothetical protein